MTIGADKIMSVEKKQKVFTNFENMIKNIDETNINRAYYIIMNSVKKTLNLKDHNSNKDIILKYLKKPINNNVFSFKPVNESIFNY